MRPALCPPIEMSKKTTGLPPAAPGIEPIPDMAQAGPGKSRRAEGAEVTGLCRSTGDGARRAEAEVRRAELECGVSGRPVRLSAGLVERARVRVRRTAAHGPERKKCQGGSRPRENKRSTCRPLVVPPRGQVITRFQRERNCARTPDSPAGTMLVQISVMCAAYQLPGGRVQPLHRPAASIGGRAVSLLMLQTEAPPRQASTSHRVHHTCACYMLRAVNEWSRRFAAPLLPLPTTCGSQTPRSITHGEPTLST